MNEIDVGPHPQESDLLMEDLDMAVLAKPPGVVVNNSQTSPGGTVQSWWFERISKLPALSSHEWIQLLPEEFDESYGSPDELFAQRQGIVHRLDKDTSGCLVLAAHPGSLINLMYQFKSRKVHKEYLCLVHGHVLSKTGTITVPIARHPAYRQKMAVVTSGRPATTEYQVMTHFSTFTSETLLNKPELKKIQPHYQGFSLLQCTPQTGRMHQIRVHMTHLGHPLVGDETYTGRKRARYDRLWCPRHFLHAAQIACIHPRTHEPVAVTAPLPLDLQTVIAQLVEISH